LVGQARVVAGGASLVQGSGGLGGMMEWDSRPSESVRGLKVNAEAGSFGSWGGSTTFTGGKSTPFRVAAALTRAENDFPFVHAGLPGKPIQKLQHASFQQQGIATDLMHSTPSQHVFSFHAMGLTNFRELPPTMLSTDQQETQQDRGARAAFNHRVPVSNQFVWESSMGGVMDWLNYDNDLAGISDTSISSRFQVRSDLRRVKKANRLLSFTALGIRCMRDWAQSESIPSGTHADLLSVHAMMSGGIYKSSGENWQWSVLLRQEWMRWKWQLPLAYIGLQHLSRYGNRELHWNIYNNRRDPTLNDLFWTPGGNPSLKPEQSVGFEWGGNWQKRRDRATASSSRKSEWDWQWAVYTQWVRDWILWVPGPAAYWTPQNEQRVWIQGFESSLNASMKIGKDWRAILSPSVGVNRAMVVSDTVQSATQLIYSPQALGKLRVGLSGKSWNFLVNAEWTSRRYTTRDNSESLAGFVLLHASASKSIAIRQHRFAIQVLGQNLSNTNYQWVAWRPMPGRSISLRLLWEWM